MPSGVNDAGVHDAGIHDSQLLDAIQDGSMWRAKAALEAGASLNGHPGLPFAPILAATVTNHVGMVPFLLGQGEDPNRPFAVEVPFPSLGMVGKTVHGERALHIAARTGKVEIVRLLLKRSHTDPDVTDDGGNTPLMACCKCPDDCVEVVRLLLEAGADLALAEEDGFIPLHMAACCNHMDVVDMLYSRAPATLNRCAHKGQTPLVVACGAGHESMVSKLLSLGAMERMPLNENSEFPLSAAVLGGSVGVMRVIINEGGIRALGGDFAVAKALCMAIEPRRARILRLLLAAGGEERRSWCADRINIDGVHLLHYGAGFCYPAGVSVLLEEGADEAVRDLDGRIPQDVIGTILGLDGMPRMDRGEEVAIRRMLQRGPAHRSRLWAWPDGGADAGSSGDGDTAAAADAVLWSPQQCRRSAVFDVRIFRPKKSSRKFFVRLVGRYCAKD